MPAATVLHRMPEQVPYEQSAMALPLGNGVQWAVVEAQTGPGRSLVIMGPGQQGLGGVMAAKDAGADLVILTGLARDERETIVGDCRVGEEANPGLHVEVGEKVAHRGIDGVDAALRFQPGIAMERVASLRRGQRSRGEGHAEQRGDQQGEPK